MERVHAVAAGRVLENLTLCADDCGAMWCFCFVSFGYLDMSGNFEQLTHLVYEASLDNSLWPELILELTEEVQRARDSRFLEHNDSKGLENLSQHFRRAFSISKRMVDLQERETYLSSVLNSFAFGVALFGETGQLLMANRSMQETLRLGAILPNGELPGLLNDKGEQSLASLVGACIQNEVSHEFQLPGSCQEPMMVLPRQEAERIGFPSIASAVLISAGRGKNDALRSFSHTHHFSRREAELLGELSQKGDLRSAAVEMGLSYESARTYLKRIYDKTGFHNQASLIAGLAATPMSALRRSELFKGERQNVRRMITLRDGRNLEYFCLGPETGDPVLVFDALSGVAIDVVGYPDLCSRYLERHNIRLITPCRSGAFRSEARDMDSLRDFTSDVEQLMEQLDLDNVGILALSFGSGSALAVAHGLGPRVRKIVLSSAAYPVYRHPNWRELDQFYHMSSILGRHWPAMLRQVIPFLVRSILQNRDNYFDRYCKRTRSADDVEILSHPVIRRRTAEMLAQRTAMGMEGMVEENLLNAQGWDFPVQDITVPVEIFQGDLDNVAPVQGAELLAQHLPDAHLTAMADKGHYHHITNWPWLLARAAGRDVEPGSERYSIPDL
ncbi:alpha/beta fold hydrolase [Parasedimentitalea huanghaiensis]|nr:alpha/beta fold hydrolase [Zongyanglinia huanghaiensis]